MGPSKGLPIVIAAVFLILILYGAISTGPLTEARWELGNSKELIVQSNLFSIRSVSDCTVLETELPFHITCMAVLKAITGSHGTFQKQVCSMDQSFKDLLTGDVKKQVLAFTDMCPSVKKFRDHSLFMAGGFGVAVLVLLIALLFSILTAL